MATKRKKVKEGKYFKTLSLLYLDEETGSSHFNFFTLLYSPILFNGYYF